jgi:hypothetical protein
VKGGLDLEDATKGQETSLTGLRRGSESSVKFPCAAILVRLLGGLAETGAIVARSLVTGAVVAGTVVAGTVVAGTAVAGAATAGASPVLNGAAALQLAASGTAAGGQAGGGYGDATPTAAGQPGIEAFGTASTYGHLPASMLTSRVIGIASTPNGQGYWVATPAGGVFSFGDATFHGSLGASTLNVPVVGIAPTPNGNGYWLATSVVSQLSRCKSSQLSVAFEPAESDGGAAGSVGLTYQFTNKSAYSCTLHGYPGFQMLGAQSRPLATHLWRQPATGPVPTVTLPPEGNAWFQIEYPAQTGYGNLHCPTSTSVEVTPPNAHHQVFLRTGEGAHLQPYGGTIEHLHCGQVSITPVAAAPPVGAGSSAFPALEVCGVGAPVAEPRSFTIACADGNSRAEDLSWRYWGATSAMARGIFTWNLCVPYCAASKTWGTRPASFTLSKPKPTSRGSLFETLTVKLEGPLPKGMERVQVYNEAPVNLAR